MKVAFISKNFPGKYSGGRIHAWTMAEGMAANGYYVDFYTDHIPVFYHDFSDFPGHNDIKLLVNRFFNFNVIDEYSLIVIVPHLNSKKSIIIDKLLFNPLIRRMKQNSQSRVLMVDFESPNWALKYIFPTRTLKDYKYSNELIADLNIILSTTKTGLGYAREYFKAFNPNLIYRQLYVSINSISAQKIGFLPKVNQIIYFARFKEKYKGSSQFLNILNSIPSGFELVVIGNRDELSPGLLSEILEIEKSKSIVVSFRHKLSDTEKFKLLSQSKLLLFNSDFEGYGLPPLEAQYVGTQVVCSDLPVLREVNKLAIFVDFNNGDLLIDAVNSAFQRNHTPEELKASVESIAKFENFAANIKKLTLTFFNHEICS